MATFSPTLAVGATHAWGWIPDHRGFDAPTRWVRTARKARIGSSTSIVGKAGSSVVRLKCGPTIAAEAGDVRSILAYRSFSMNVMSPGPASPTGRAEWIGTLPSPMRRPRTRAASCSTVATTRDFLSSLKGMDEDGTEGAVARSGQPTDSVRLGRRGGW